MSTITIEEIQRDPSDFIHRVTAGEEILVVDAGRTVAEVKPVGIRIASPRPWGLAAGEFTVPDDFDAPLPDEVLKEFEGR